MLTDEERNYILKEHLRIIHHISDKEYQRRIWIRGEGLECSNFGDAVNNYASDAVEILQNYKKYGISQTQLEALEKF